MGEIEKKKFNRMLKRRLLISKSLSYFMTDSSFQERKEDVQFYKLHTNFILITKSLYDV